MTLRKGDRVRLNASAKAEGCTSKHFGETGIIATTSRDESWCVAVLWPGRKTADYWHPDYLAMAKDDKPESHTFLAELMELRDWVKQRQYRSAPIHAVEVMDEAIRRIRAISATHPKDQ